MPLSEEDLAQRVRAAIEASGMTHEAVARAIGIDPSALSKALSGRRNLSSMEFARLCGTLDLSPLVLLDTGEPPPDPAAEDMARVRRAAELDALLAGVGYPAARDRRYPATLLDRAIEAWLAGQISIRPIAGLIGIDSDDLMDEVDKSRPPRR